MPEDREWLSQKMERRRFLRRSSELAAGGMAMLAAGSAFEGILGPKFAASAAEASGTSSVKGITLAGLQPNPSTGKFKSFNQMKSEIDASRQNFGATHIRLQIQQQSFIGDGSQYNADYAGAVSRVIDYALGQKLTVIINCQTEQSDRRRTYPYPNFRGDATNEFWRYMLTSAGKNYGNHPRIICDIFNEPQCGGPTKPNWSLWRRQYQGLVTYIRSLDVRNQLWADADAYAASFAGLREGLNDPVGDLVYSFHHPHTGVHGDSEGWDSDFGNWAAGHAVVNGEFAQNSTFNWGSPYEIQKYLNYCAGRGIGHTLFTVYGDDYFSDSSLRPYGWWGNMINDFWNPGKGWTSYSFRSSVAWSQNYIMKNGNKLSWDNGLYQGWSDQATPGGSMVAGLAGFNSLSHVMGFGKQYRMHVSAQCVYPDHGSVTAALGVHGLSSPPSNWSKAVPQDPNIVEKHDLKKGEWFNMDIPSDHYERFATGYYKGIMFGPGPYKDGGPGHPYYFSGHMSFTPEVVIEVHP